MGNLFACTAKLDVSDLLTDPKVSFSIEPERLSEILQEKKKYNKKTRKVMYQLVQDQLGDTHPNFVRKELPVEILHVNDFTAPENSPRSRVDSV